MRVAVVLQTQGTRAQVSASSHGGCSSCAEKGACGLQILPVSEKPEILEVENRTGARVGDTVEIDLAGHTELWLSLLVWAVPLVALLLGAIAGVAVHGALGMDEDLAGLAGAALGFAGAFAMLRRIDRLVACDRRLVPYVVRVIRPNACADPLVQLPLGKRKA